MTLEQERIYKQGLWDMHICENYLEDVAEYFFKLGLATKDK